MIFSTLPGIWKAFAIIRRIPETPRRKIYRFVASRRYGWFGSVQSCSVLCPDQLHKFVDRP